jgi:hypothetical protein
MRHPELVERATHAQFEGWIEPLAKLGLPGHAGRMDFDRPMPLWVRLTWAFGPLVVAILGAVCYVNLAIEGVVASTGIGLVVANMAVIAASLWTVFFLRRTSLSQRTPPDQR